MARLSSVQRLPRETQEMIGRLRQEGRTIDEILGALLDAGVIIPRSTLGRHIQHLDVVGARLRESREAAEALILPIADAGEERQTRALVGILQSMMMDVLAARSGDDQASIDTEEFMLFARALKDLAAARKVDADLMIRVRKEIVAQVAETAEAAVRAAAPQINPETLRTIREQIYGIAG